MEIVEGGFYILSDQYFEDFPDPYLKQNKAERGPFYYCAKDLKTEFLWMVPLSSSANKVALAKRKISEGKTDLFYPTLLGGKEGVMLIADMCPVSPDYVKCHYTILDIPVVFKDRSEMEAIARKVSKVKALLRRGTRFTDTPPDIFKIEQALIVKQKKR